MRRIAVGQTYGRLTAVVKIPKNSRGSHGTKWVCVCSCGTMHTVAGGSLGVNVNSCGCLNEETLAKRRHGQKNTPTWNSWHSMIQRCSDQNCKGWKNYGGRGIKICEGWRDFRIFVADMGKKPIGTTLGRIDNDGNYEPSNCRWETDTQQNRNSRNCRTETINGQSLIVTEWAEQFGLDRKRLFNLMRKRSLADAMRQMGASI